MESKTSTPESRREFEEYWEKEGVTIEPPVLQLAFKEVAQKAWQAAREQVTEQRDRAWQKIENQAERITYLEGATNHATGTPLSKAIKQRDRLAEALRKCREDSVCHQRRMEDLGYTYAAKESQANSDRAYIALQSLTTNEL
jgi:TRAP-type C4-dicarboxylate transport system substrate-binding protein